MKEGNIGKKNGAYDSKGSSQSEQLNRDIKQVYVLLVLAAVSLIAFIAISIYNTQMLNEETETTTFLNQYRIGSKALTAAVQSYAVTGEKSFYDDYMRELEVDMNRDIAWAGLEKNDVSEDEWAMMNSIAGMSNGLVTLETAAMDAVSAGNSEAAIEEVFGEEYQSTIREINDQTELLISTVQKRLQKKTDIMEGIQYAMCFIFILSVTS